MRGQPTDPFGALTPLALSEGATSFYRVGRLEELGLASVDRLPFSIRVLLENVLRKAGKGYVSEEDVEAVAAWSPTSAGASIPFMPSRVVLQDFTGVPAVVDLAAMRDALARLGGPAERINPQVPADLVIDHSVQVDFSGTRESYRRNVEREYERNGERYQLLRWAQNAFANFQVVPPGTGIVHQINLEYLACVMHRREEDGVPLAFPDTVVGTDSHTTMINGLGVVGWGVGGIEAEAVLLGQPYHMLLPEVVGVRMTGTLPEGATATDLVLRVTEMLRSEGVVGRFVEFCGPGLSALTLPDRATLANMSPEYGATIGFFPVDDEALRYLEGSGRSPAVVERVERASKAMALFRTDETPDPEYTVTLRLDLGSVVPSVAGPRRPQDRIALGDLTGAFRRDLPGLLPQGFSVPAQTAPAGAPGWTEEVAGQLAEGGVAVAVAEAEDEARIARLALDDDQTVELTDGSIVIAAITSCTNTSNPSVMVGAGLLARNAVERGLRTRPGVKTSMAPGSKVVTDYLEGAGLLPHLAELGFDVVGYGCTTCIGNSGPLPEPIAEAVEAQGLVVSSVLSGNRNFEARIHSLVRANYLASPMLVVAFALAGRVDINLDEDPLGEDKSGEPVYLRDIWPSQAEIQSTIRDALRPEMYRDRYAEVFEGDELWRALPLPEGDVSLYEWDDDSTYIRNPPFFEGMSLEGAAPGDIVGARVLALLGETVTTDHISPAGAIPRDEPAGRYLTEHGVRPWEFNTFGARRGNHEVMMRGTFGNVRIRNLLLDGKEGGYTRFLPDGDVLPIYEASMRYQAAGTPLVVLAGREYGTGSSRDWAAKGSNLLGVRAVIATSYERIHRSNLVGMGVLPLQFPAGESARSLGLDGTETFDILGIADGVAPNSTLRVTARKSDGSEVGFEADVRLDSDVEVEYYLNGGILHTVLRKLARGEM
ncbi:MAG: aconitate hydratase AcnA [Gammaproteobacteria bacterium]|nr:aconitate hydratase AcnA [Gammaproteobacteria bacterium]MDE0246406.1 aconitate hydratase AcnA [Gammaproteobacteria bacterium]